MINGNLGFYFTSSNAFKNTALVCSLQNDSLKCLHHQKLIPPLRALHFPDDDPVKSVLREDSLTSLRSWVQNGILGEHGCRWPCSARGLTDGSLTCASRQERSCWTRDFPWLAGARSQTAPPVADVNVIGFEHALLLFSCGRETSSETQMKFQPYLREHVWDSGMQWERREPAPFQAFCSCHPARRIVCRTLKFLNSAGILKEYRCGMLVMSLPLFAYCHIAWPAL